VGHAWAKPSAKVPKTTRAMIFVFFEFVFFEFSFLAMTSPYLKVAPPATTLQPRELRH
jgi:hypothetical protein